MNHNNNYEWNPQEKQTIFCALLNGKKVDIKPIKYVEPGLNGNSSVPNTPAHETFVFFDDHLKL
jgi:hypothetical protein